MLHIFIILHDICVFMFTVLYEGLHYCMKMKYNILLDFASSCGITLYYIALYYFLKPYYSIRLYIMFYYFEFSCLDFSYVVFLFALLLCFT